MSYSKKVKIPSTRKDLQAFLAKRNSGSGGKFESGDILANDKGEAYHITFPSSSLLPRGCSPLKGAAFIWFNPRD